MDIGKVSPTPQHLIVEYQSTESIMPMRLPSLKIRGNNVGGLRHLQVMRFVYTICEADDVYFEGRRLSSMPGMRELILEWIRPGQQIVSVPNGRFSVLHAYTGKKNIMQAHVSQRVVGSAPMGFIDLFGEDPAPERVLYGNPAVPFVQRGDDLPTAAAYYNTASRRFEIIQNVERNRLLPEFLRRFGRREATVG